jgi:hypothetical protein
VSVWSCLMDRSHAARERRHPSTSGTANQTVTSASGRYRHFRKFGAGKVPPVATAAPGPAALGAVRLAHLRTSDYIFRSDLNGP